MPKDAKDLKPMGDASQWVCNSTPHQFDPNFKIPLGQFWEWCPYEWGLENYITIESSQGRMILVDRWQEAVTGMIGSAPAKISEVRTYEEPLDD